MRLSFTSIALFLSIGLLAQSSLVLHYPINPNTISLDETQLLDEGPHGNNAKITGTIFYDDDSFGGDDEAIMVGNLGEMDRYIQTTSPLHLGGSINDFTLSFWFIHGDVAFNETAVVNLMQFEDNDGNELFLGLDRANKQLNLQLRNDEQELFHQTTTINLNSFNWQHLAITYDQNESNLIIYHNGLLTQEIEVEFNFPYQPYLNMGIEDNIPLEDINFCYDEIRLYNQHLAPEDIQVILQNSTNVEVELMTEQISIFPNPASLGDKVNISNMTNAQVQILDAKGQLIRKTALNNGALDISGLTIGTYFVQLINNEQRIVKKMLIQP